MMGDVEIAHTEPPIPYPEFLGWKEQKHIFQSVRRGFFRICRPYRSWRAAATVRHHSAIALPAELFADLEQFCERAAAFNGTGRIAARSIRRSHLDFIFGTVAFPMEIFRRGFGGQADATKPLSFHCRRACRRPFTVRPIPTLYAASFGLPTPAAPPLHQSSTFYQVAGKLRPGMTLPPSSRRRGGRRSSVNTVPPVFGGASVYIAALRRRPDLEIPGHCLRLLGTVVFVVVDSHAPTRPICCWRGPAGQNKRKCESDVRGCPRMRLIPAVILTETCFCRVSGLRAWLAIARWGRWVLFQL